MEQEAKKKEQEKVHANVQFGTGNAIAVTGILAGVAIALGFAWIVLEHGQVLGSTLVVIFVLSALFIGGVVALVSAFFGLVMPRQVDGGAPFGRYPWRHWARKHWCDWAHDEDLDDEDTDDWSKEDWKAWGEKMKKKWKGKMGRFKG